MPRQSQEGRYKVGQDYVVVVLMTEVVKDYMQISLISLFAE